MHTFVEMSCACGAQFSLDTEQNEDAIWMLILRFANAHVECGYMTPGTSPEVEGEQTKQITPTRRKVKKREVFEEDDDE